jgi:hypothetical protein
LDGSPGAGVLSRDARALPHKAKRSAAMPCSSSFPVSTWTKAIAVTPAFSWRLMFWMAFAGSAEILGAARSRRSGDVHPPDGNGGRPSPRGASAAAARHRALRRRLQAVIDRLAERRQREPITFTTIRSTACHAADHGAIRSKCPIAGNTVTSTSSPKLRALSAKVRLCSTGT